MDDSFRHSVCDASIWSLSGPCGADDRDQGELQQRRNVIVQSRLTWPCNALSCGACAPLADST